MKHKHHGLACLIIFVITFAGMISYGVYLSNQISGSIHILPPPSAPDIIVPDKSTIAYIDFLNLQLQNLTTPEGSPVEVDLKLFGFKPLKPVLERDSIKKSEIPITQPDSEYLQETNVQFLYSLSLCFASKTNNFCIIDGKIYKENNQLPDGGKILTIENDRVYIKKNKWIYPLQQRKVSNVNNEEAI